VWWRRRRAYESLRNLTCLPTRTTHRNVRSNPLRAEPTCQRPKPRTTQKHVVRHITRLFRENNETLFAYAKFIGEPTDDVLNQLVETVLEKDKDFQAWRTEAFLNKRGIAFTIDRSVQPNWGDRQEQLAA